MSAFAFGLVLAAAFSHATWNVLAKQTGGKAPFLWLAAAISALIYFPLVLALFFWQRPKTGSVELFVMAGSALIHLVYFLVLQKGYRVADLSIVYPLARGTGPAASTLGAILLFDEHPSLAALFGVLLIIVGIFKLTRGSYHANDLASVRKGRVYGILTGLVIAAYTLWDKHAVSVVMVSPLILEYSSTLARVILLAPIAFRERRQILVEWRDHQRQVLGVGVLNPLSFILVLTALVRAPVSYVAPARELSILVGVVLGGRLLSEGDTKKRLIASGFMLAGIIALALG